MLHRDRAGAGVFDQALFWIAQHARGGVQEVELFLGVWAQFWVERTDHLPLVRVFLEPVQHRYVYGPGVHGVLRAHE